MTRRVSRLPVASEHPTQLVLGLPVPLVLLGNRSRAKGKYVGGGGFAMPVPKAQERAA